MSTLSIQFRPQLIASAAILMASKICNVKLGLVDGKEWWFTLKFDLGELEEICSQISEIYEQSGDENPKLSQTQKNTTIKDKNIPRITDSHKRKEPDF